jgi:hypothetical protein
MPKDSTTDSAAVKLWVRTQEEIMKLEQHLTALSNFMEKNASAAQNPARQAQTKSLARFLSRSLEKLPEIEKGIAGNKLAELKAELAEIQQKERKRKLE